MTEGDDTDYSNQAPADKASICPRCGARLTCGMVTGAATCWCASLPVLASADKAAAACYCPACLRELLAAEAAEGAGAAGLAAVPPAPTFGSTGAPDSTHG